MIVFGMTSLHSSLFIILVAVLVIWSNNNIIQANSGGSECKTCKSAGEHCVGGGECCSTVCATSEEDVNPTCALSKTGGCCNNINDCAANNAFNCENRKCISALIDDNNNNHGK